MGSISKAIIGPVNSGTISYSDSVSQPFRKQLSRSVWIRKVLVSRSDRLSHIQQFSEDPCVTGHHGGAEGIPGCSFPPGTNSQEAVSPPEEEQLPSFTDKPIESEKDHITCSLPHCSKRRFQTLLVPALCCCVETI